MEVETIDMVSKDLNVEQIVQDCSCTYNDKTVEFKVIRDELGIFDDIMFPDEEGKLDYEYTKDDKDDDDIKFILGAIDQGDYIQALKAHSVGLEFRMSHVSLKRNDYEMHFPKPYFYDKTEGPIVIRLLRNELVLVDE